MRTYTVSPGDKFGVLTVVGRSPEMIGDRRLWVCKCDCGNTKLVRTNFLKRGAKSCSLTCPSKIRNKSLLPDGLGAINCMMSIYKIGARKRGLSWGLSQDQFRALVSGNCYYCGAGQRKIHTVTSEAMVNGIDRMDHTVGYELANCVSCCKICNFAKGVMSDSEFESWINRVYEHIKAR